MTVRIGLVFPGDISEQAAWSGTPNGLARGLEEAGVEVVPIRAKPPAALNTAAVRLVAASRARPPFRGGLISAVRCNRNIAVASRELVAVRNLSVRVALKRAGPVSALIQIGTSYELPARVPIATYEDQTVRQAETAAYDPLTLPCSEISAWVARQSRAYARAAACCTMTNWAAESVRCDYDVPPGKVHVVGVGRDQEPARGPRDWRAPRFLFVGADWERKNGSGLLRAFIDLKQRIPSAQLDVVGNHPPVDLEGVAAHGPLRRDRPAERDRLMQLFGSATCFVMPSHREPCGIAYVEAAASGVPSIGTTVGGSREVIGEGGRVIVPDDHAALLGAMMELSDPQVARRLGQLAEQRSELFTWRRVAERMLRALNRHSASVGSPGT